jgi:L-aspartate oxidase
MEGGHSHNRIDHSADMTGRGIERALLQAVGNDNNISLHFASDLLTCQVVVYITLITLID